MEVVTCGGRAESLAFRLDADAVRIWWQGRCVAVFSREHVMAWLAKRTRVSSGALTLRRDAERRPALLLTDVGLWTVAPQALTTLNRLIWVPPGRNRTPGVARRRRTAGPGVSTGPSSRHTVEPPAEAVPFGGAADDGQAPLKPPVPALSGGAVFVVGPEVVHVCRIDGQTLAGTLNRSELVAWLRGDHSSAPTSFAPDVVHLMQSVDLDLLRAALGLDHTQEDPPSSPPRTSTEAAEDPAIAPDDDG